MRVFHSFKEADERAILAFGSGSPMGFHRAVVLVALLDSENSTMCYKLWIQKVSKPFLASVITPTICFTPE